VLKVVSPIRRLEFKDPAPRGACSILARRHKIRRFNIGSEKTYFKGGITVLKRTDPDFDRKNVYSKWKSPILSRYPVDSNHEVCNVGFKIWKKKDIPGVQTQVFSKSIYFLHPTDRPTHRREGKPGINSVGLNKKKFDIYQVSNAPPAGSSTGCMGNSHEERCAGHGVLTRESSGLDSEYLAQCSELAFEVWIHVT
jgi:hypothetical protein